MVCACAAHAQPDGQSLDARIAHLQQRITALKANEDIEAAVRDQAVQIDQQALAALQSAQSDRQRSAALQETVRQAPAEIADTDSRLSDLAGPPQASDLQQLSAAALAARMDSVNTRLADTQAQLSDLRDRLTRLAQQPEAARQELTETRNALESLEPTANGGQSQSSLLVQAQRGLLAARQLSLSAHIARLQQELSSLDARERLLQARRTFAEAQLSVDSESLAAVRLALDKRQNETAQRLHADTRNQFEQLRAAPAPIMDAARDNVDLAGQLVQVTVQDEALARRQTVQRNRVDNIERRLNLVRRQLEIGGGSAALGKALRAQQRKLAAAANAGAQALPGTAPDIGAIELQRFQDRQRRAEINDISAMVAGLAAQPGTSLSPRQRQTLVTLLQRRREILDLLIDAEGRLIDIGRDLNALARQYDNAFASVNRLLNERLFWLPSFSPLAANWPVRVATQLPWAVDPVGWRRAVQAVAGGARNRPFLAAIAVVVICVLLGIRRVLRHRLKYLAAPVGAVQRDSFWLTLRAGAITMLLSAPFVVLLLAVGYLMRQATGIDAFTRAVATAVMQLGALTLFIEPFVQICRNNGLGDAHFRWRDLPRRKLYRSLRWLLAMLAVPTLLITLTGVVDEDAKSETLGRAGFMLGSLVMAGFAWRLLHPRHGVLADVLCADDEPVWRMAYLWLPLAAGIPLLLAGVAAWGYYYPALQLQTRFFLSAGLLGGCMILYSLIVRWLTVAERRLALARALRKREEARAVRAAREAAAVAGDSTPDNLDTLEIDLPQISEQTRGLIKLFIALLIGAGLWLIWSDTLPALQLLNNVTLWRHNVSIGGHIELSKVTLGALLLALVVGVLTALAGRNLPGFLEITVLRRFSMDAGSRYAMATLFQYAIVIAGLVVAVSLIGLRWSSIQWLVAAIGVGLGFGLQEIFANIVSGIVILFERPVRVGDTVTVGSLTGTVSRIRIRATTITDWDNKELVIPNKTFITETVINWTLTDDITRLVVRVGLALDTDTRLAEELIMAAIKAEPVALEQPAPSVFLVGYGDSAILYEARVFYHGLYNLLPLQHALYKRILAAFAEHDVEITFPQRDLHLRSMDASFTRFGAGKRRRQPARDDGDAGAARKPR